MARSAVPWHHLAMTKAQRSKILSLADEGHSQREIARRTGVSRPTVARVVADAAEAAPRAARAADAPADDLLATLQARGQRRAASPPDAPADDSLDALSEVRAAMRSARDDATAARACGDVRAVQIYSGVLSRLVPALARLEAAQAKDADSLTFSRAELEQAYRSLVVRVVNPLRAREGLEAIDPGDNAMGLR